jgi:hypothetical protein
MPDVTCSDGKNSGFLPTSRGAKCLNPGDVNYWSPGQLWEKCEAVGEIELVVVTPIRYY